MCEEWGQWMWPVWHWSTRQRCMESQCWALPGAANPIGYKENTLISKDTWVRSRNCGCLVTWFCYQLIAKPGNKTATVSWPDPYDEDPMNLTWMLSCIDFHLSFCLRFIQFIFATDLTLLLWRGRIILLRVTHLLHRSSCSLGIRPDYIACNK